MADRNYVSKVKLSSTTYFLKDEEARAAVEALKSTVASSLVFKGVVSSATGITSLANYECGWTYRVTDYFELGNLGNVEPGDMIICIADGATYQESDWTVVQNNVDLMQGATEEENGTMGLVPAPSAGDNSRFLRGDGTWAEMPYTPDQTCEWETFENLLADIEANSTVVWGSFSSLVG